MLLILATRGALACGGFFCNNAFPIDQAAEQIVFGIDEDAGEVTVHVGITYAGESGDFAWVVPVPSEPDLFVSSDALLSTIEALTRPTFSLAYDQTGSCEWGRGDESSDTGDIDLDADDDGGGVTVVAEARVGPYDTVTLQAESATELLEWLETAGYDLPADLDPVLAPYVAQGQYFVALKLSTGQDAGDIAPLGMRYPGTAASVPIQLTSIAATPDMRLEVYVLGDRRAVPDNYLHVTINEAAIDWFNGGRNYLDVITVAADEAGGHAFATDFSGSTLGLRGRVFDDSSYRPEHLRSQEDPFAWLEALMGMGLPPSAALLAVLQDVIPFPAELADQVTPQSFYDCLSCFAEYVDPEAFDADAATDVLEERVIDGLRAAERLLAAHPHVSRLTSSLDAVEMTVDPLFTFNGDLPQYVRKDHRATVVHHCGLGDGWYDAERTLVLPDGRELRLPSQDWLADRGITELEWLGSLTSPAAIVIEDYADSGLGEVLFDWRAQAAQAARSFGRPCGCATGGAPLAATSGLLVLATLLRRRRG